MKHFYYKFRSRSWIKDPVSIIVTLWLAPHYQLRLRVAPLFMVLVSAALFFFPICTNGLELSSLDGLTNNIASTNSFLKNPLSDSSPDASPSPLPPERKSKKKSLPPPPPSFITHLNLKRMPDQPKDYHKVSRVSKKIEVLEELECVQTMFMSPFHFPVHFSLNDTIYNRVNRKCRWSFIGTELCIPMLSCDTSQMRSCDQEYMEIVDGHKGYYKACAGDKVEKLSAADDLRDLFIHFKAIKKSSEAGTGKVFLNCTVSCSRRGQGAPLPHKFQKKVNPKCYCGTKPNDDKIVGGDNAKKFEFPWLVALIETNTRQPFCGGSIINDRYILTAGHCIKGKFVDYRNIQVATNGHQFDESPNQNILRDFSEPKTYSEEELEKLDKGNGSARYNIEEIIVHPLYVSENNDFDVALLKLQKRLDLSSRPVALNESPLQQPRAVCLPPIGSYLRTYSNKKAIVAGWGLSGIDAVATPHILQKLEVNVFSPTTCRELFAHRVNRRMICAGHRDGGKDSCSGDSGGPLVLEDRPKVWTQIGSVSWGEGCGEEGNPGVYFRTTEGLQWINYITNFHTGADDEDNEGGKWCVVP